MVGRALYSARSLVGKGASYRNTLVPLECITALDLPHRTDPVARKDAATYDFVCGHQETMMDEVFMGCDDLFVGRVLEGATEVFAVDLAMTQKGAEAGVENLRGGGERGGPDLRLVPEGANIDGVLRARAAGVVEKGDLRQNGFHLHHNTVRTVSPTVGVWIL